MQTEKKNNLKATCEDGFFYGLNTCGHLIFIEFFEVFFFFNKKKNKLDIIKRYFGYR